MGGQNLYELAFETVVKFITSLILDVKREKTDREQPIYFSDHIQNFRLGTIQVLRQQRGGWVGSENGNFC